MNSELIHPIEITFTHAADQRLVQAWLDQNVGVYSVDWDIQLRPELDKISYVFKTPQTAMMFALKWA